MATKTDNQSELRTVTTTVPSTESSTATGTATTTYNRYHDGNNTI